MPRQGTRTPRRPVVNDEELQEKIRQENEENLMTEIREVMANIREGVNLENTLASIVEKLSEVMSPQYRQILTVALGNVRKLNTNFLYREHSILALLIPATEIEAEEEPEDVDDEE